MSNYQLSMSKGNTYKLQNEAISNTRAEVMVIKMIIITKSNLSIGSDDSKNNINNVKL
jgi:hypothetical protein